MLLQGEQAPGKSFLGMAGGTIGLYALAQKLAFMKVGMTVAAAAMRQRIRHVLLVAGFAIH